MPKTDKELAVDIVCAYLRARFSREDQHSPLSGYELMALAKDAYDAVHALPDDSEN